MRRARSKSPCERIKGKEGRALVPLVPAKGRTHNHQAQSLSLALPFPLLRRMGPRFRGDDNGEEPANNTKRLRSFTMIKVKRLGHATIATPDLDAMVDYYGRLLGLAIIERSKDRVFL